MIKKNLQKLLLTSAVILLPVVAGLLLWDRLPDTMNIHWGAHGQADGTAGRTFTILAPSLFILATHWLCVLVTARDPKNQNQTKKAMGITLWICPVLSLMTSAITYGIALGAEFNLASFTFATVGIVFLLVGNYLPKVKQNHTIGIKVSWALKSEENWNATHRFSGKLWVGGGIAQVLLAFLPIELTVLPMILIILVMSFTPMLYSWHYYKKQVKAGTASNAVPAPQDKFTMAVTKYTLIFVAVVFIGVAILLFSGDISVVYSDTSFTINASYWDDLTIDYADIESIEFREQDDPGTRVWGFGSFRLLMGSFQNEEFGNYTRYSYVDPESCVVLTVKGKTLVISGRDTESTEALYEQLWEKIG